MSGMEIYKVGKSLVRTSKREWKDMIYTKRGQKVQMKEEMLFMSWDEYS